MPEITPADEVRARHLVPAATTMAMVPVVESRRKELAAAFASHREAAVAEERERIILNLRPLAEVVGKTWGLAEHNGFTMAIEEIERMSPTPAPQPLTPEIELLTQERDEWKRKYHDLLEDYDRVNEGI